MVTQKEISIGQAWHSCIEIRCLDYQNGGGPCQKRISGEIECPALTAKERQKYNGHLLNRK